MAGGHGHVQTPSRLYRFAAFWLFMTAVRANHSSHAPYVCRARREGDGQGPENWPQSDSDGMVAGLCFHRAGVRPPAGATRIPGLARLVSWRHAERALYSTEYVQYCCYYRCYAAILYLGRGTATKGLMHCTLATEPDLSQANCPSIGQ